MSIIALSNVNQLPRVTALPLYHESAEQAAARWAQRWGCPVTVYRVGVKCPMVFIGKKKEGE